MLPGYTSFIGKMRGTYSCKGLVLYRKHFIKHNSAKILWEKSRSIEPLWAEISCSNENAVLRLYYQPPAQTCNSAQEM